MPVPVLDIETAWQLRQAETLPAIFDLCYPTGDVARFCEGRGLVPQANWYVVATDFVNSGAPPFLAVVRHAALCYSYSEARRVLHQMRYLHGLMDFSICEQLPPETVDDPTWWQVHTDANSPVLWDVQLSRQASTPDPITMH